jgi:hypothetical protein
VFTPRAARECQDAGARPWPACAVRRASGISPSLAAPRSRTVRRRCHARRTYQPFQCAAHPTARKGVTGPADPRLLGRVGSSFSLTPCSGRRGRRFKSGHPDREMAGHKASSDLPFVLHIPGCPILGARWERTQVMDCLVRRTTAELSHFRSRAHGARRTQAGRRPWQEREEFADRGAAQFPPVAGQASRGNVARLGAACRS